MRRRTVAALSSGRRQNDALLGLQEACLSVGVTGGDLWLGLALSNFDSNCLVNQEVHPSMARCALSVPRRSWHS